VPHLPNQFLAAHASGYLYLYDEQLPCSNVAPTYNVLHEGSGFAIQNYSSKSVRNPLYRWFFDGGGAIHEFAFSPCARYLAIVFANGQLRIFNYHRMELLGVMRSYFGGLRCVAWSPDGRYVATGGEDDLITVWSFDERRIVCRGAGHHSWINSIAFDPYTTSIPAGSARKMENGDGLQHRNQTQSAPQSDAKTPTPAAGDGMSDHGAVSYRLGTVGDDTFLCLWELTEDVLKQRPSQTWNSDSASSMSADQHVTHPNGDLPEARGGGSPTTKATPVVPSNASPQAAFTATALSQNFSSLQVSDQVPSKDAANNTVKRQLSSTATTTSLGKSAGAKNRPKSSNNSNRTSSSDDGANACKLGSPSYPRLNDVPLLEPMVCKKIAGDRLTALVFREDCIVTACQDGIVSTWSRPGRVITSGCS
jgi:WD40 repeat protein